MALPALHWIRAKFPNARITLLTNSPVNGKASPASTILESTGLVNYYMAYPLGTRNLASLFRLRHEIACRRFGAVFALAEARGRMKAVRDWVFFKSCRIPRVIGSALRRKDLICMPCTGGESYESEASRLVRRAGGEGQVDFADDCWWDLHLNSNEKRAVDDLLAKHLVLCRFIAFSLGTKLEVNDWTLPNWRHLVTKLGSKHPGLPLIGIGVAGERQNTDEVLRLWPGPRLNLCGILSPRTTGAVLKRAAIFVGHDSGPMHLAAAVGTKCVAIFSARNSPGQWFPRGQGHRVLYHRTDCFNCGLSVCREHGKKCILGISVEEVLGAIEQVLKSELQTNARPDTLSAKRTAVCAHIQT